MKMNDITQKLQSLEMKSSPKYIGGRLIPSKACDTVNGKKVEAKSQTNRGLSGKGFTTLWYVNGLRVAKAKLESVIVA